MRIAERPSISSMARASSRAGESQSSISPFPEKTRTRCGPPGAGSAPTMSLSIIPPTAYPCCFTHSRRCEAPSNPCSSPERAANKTVARPPCPAAAALLSNRADSSITATPEESSSARRIGFGIHHFRGPGVEVPVDNENRFRQRGVRAWQDSVHVFHVHGFPSGTVGRHFEFIHDDLQLSTGILRDCIEPGHDKIAPAADAALWICPRGKRQPCSTADLFMDQVAHRLFIHALPRDCACRPRQNLRMRPALQRLGRIVRNALCLRWRTSLRTCSCHKQDGQPGKNRRLSQFFSSSFPAFIHRGRFLFEVVLIGLGILTPSRLHCDAIARRLVTCLRFANARGCVNVFCL